MHINFWHCSLIQYLVPLLAHVSKLNLLRWWWLSKSPVGVKLLSEDDGPSLVATLPCSEGGGGWDSGCWMLQICCTCKGLRERVIFWEKKLSLLVQYYYYRHSIYILSCYLTGQSPCQIGDLSDLPTRQKACVWLGTTRQSKSLKSCPRKKNTKCQYSQCTCLLGRSRRWRASSPRSGSVGGASLGRGGGGGGKELPPTNIASLNWVTGCFKGFFFIHHSNTRPGVLTLL